MNSPNVHSRFWEKVDRSAGPDACWPWIAAINGQTGYGWFWWQGGTESAHRVAYTIAVGSIPDGLELDHICRNRDCVNPAHLEPVTHRENIRRSPVGLIARFGIRTACSAGHPYTPANTLIRTRGRKGTFRQCRECMKVYRRRAAAKPRAAVT